MVKERYIRGKHPHMDPDYMKDVESACLNDPGVQQEVKKLRLPPGATVVIEPWPYATDGMRNMSKRKTMVCALSIA